VKSFKNNQKKQQFLNSRPQTSLETCNIALRCKFNFSFFDSQQGVSQSFADWNAQGGICSLDSVFEKFKEYSKQPLSYWRNERCGAGGLKILAYYNEFPNKSDFIHSAHIPHDVCWARFRLGNKVRLIGFVVSEKLNGTNYESQGKTYTYDSNTFYLVFLDKEHSFYKTEKA